VNMSARAAARLTLSSCLSSLRAVVGGATCALALLLLSGVDSSAWAGRQVEEPLADSVRSALSLAISGSHDLPVLVFANQAQRETYERWAEFTGNRLLKRMPDQHVRSGFLQSVWYESKRAGLDPSLVMGLIEVESGFRKYAISSVGARGYMQIMPFWSRLIGNSDASTLFHMPSNLRFGCTILRHYLDRERGDLYMALGRYNGSRGRSPYPNAVFASWRKWKVPEMPAQRVAAADAH